MASGTCDTGNSGKTKPVLRKAKVQDFSPKLSSKTCEFCIKVVMLSFKMQYRYTYNRGSHQKQLTLMLNVSNACEKGIWLSAASFGKIFHSRGSHVHHILHPLTLNILAATLEVII